MIHCNRQHLPLRLLHLSPDYDDSDDDDDDDDDDDEFGEFDDPL